MDIKKIVNSLVKKHKTRNPFEIVKGMNVILVPVPLEGVRGFYQYFQRLKPVSPDLTVDRQFFRSHANF